MQISPKCWFLWSRALDKKSLCWFLWSPRQKKTKFEPENPGMYSFKLLSWTVAHQDWASSSSYRPWIPIKPWSSMHKDVTKIFVACHCGTLAGHSTVLLVHMTSLLRQPRHGVFQFFPGKNWKTWKCWPVSITCRAAQRLTSPWPTQHWWLGLGR